MTRYISDQNKVVLVHESGTYANTSGNGVWAGQVTDNSVDDNEGKIVDYFLGTNSRSYGQATLGPQDVTGTLTYHPQDMRILFFAIGSVVDVAPVGVNTSHTVTQVNTNAWGNAFVSGTGQCAAPMSFTLEDSKRSPVDGENFVRTIRGCVPGAVKLNLDQGEKVTIETDYIAQSLTYSSGATLVSTGSNISTTPYLWSDAILTLSGTTVNTAKSITLEINNNIDPPHYINGSRVIGTPILGNREIKLDVTLDLESSDAKLWYDTLYKGNSLFDSTLELNADNATTGSAHVILSLGSCNIITMDNPSATEGTTESAISIMAQSIIGSSIDAVAKYNPW